MRPKTVTAGGAHCNKLPEFCCLSPSLLLSTQNKQQIVIIISVQLLGHSVCRSLGVAERPARVYSAGIRLYGAFPTKPSNVWGRILLMRGLRRRRSLGNSGAREGPFWADSLVNTYWLRYMPLKKKSPEGLSGAASSKFNFTYRGLLPAVPGKRFPSPTCPG